MIPLATMTTLCHWFIRFIVILHHGIPQEQIIQKGFSEKPPCLGLGEELRLLGKSNKVPFLKAKITIIVAYAPTENAEDDAKGGSRTNPTSILRTT